MAFASVCVLKLLKCVAVDLDFMLCQVVAADVVGIALMAVT